MNILQRSKTEFRLTEKRSEFTSQPQVTRPIKTLHAYKRIESGHNETQLLCCRFDPEDMLIAAGASNGSIYIFPVGTALERPITIQPQSGEETGLPIPCVRWRPHSGVEASKNILVSACADGTVSFWHGTSGKLLESITEKDNQVYCLDYNLDGSRLATAGLDKTIRVYDDSSKRVVSSLATAVWRHPGHSNRIYSVKFDPANPNMIVSGGWDKTVYFWDLRAGKSIGSISGPAIHGDSLDVKNNQVLTGSCRPKDQLELWSVGTRKKISTLVWDKGYHSDNNLVYSCQFSKRNNDSLLAGCSGRSEVKIFETNDEYNSFGSMQGPKKGVYSFDYAHKSDIIAYCGGDGGIQLASIQDKYTSLTYIGQEQSSGQ